MIKPLIFGHRGSPSVVPENTMQSFKQAFKEGADGIELDVRLTNDKKIIVIHDETVDRTTNGTGLVKELTFKEINRLTIDKKLRIPSLEEVVKFFGNDKWLNIEIKEPRFEKQLIDLLNDLQITQKIIISSFFVKVIQNLNKTSSEFSTAFLFNYRIEDFKSLKDEKNINAIHPHQKLINQELIAEARKNKLQIRAWTVDNPKIAIQLAKFGVEGIITNVPKKIINKLKSNNQ